ncbi:hypothetical protein BS47DRAFT_1351409 [Hydnum rufescens UP504]|uniref:Uncharacterized protein n=1 Tax=Hydnum rufescens UP504 TaxID=1448309 RepID=A0A9P6ALA8_9AGAM|nr:hypothetical protein BS47DRAFT_1351409 [Hydnum rufescens UP504]
MSPLIFLVAGFTLSFSTIKAQTSDVTCWSEYEWVCTLVAATLEAVAACNPNGILISSLVFDSSAFPGNQYSGPTTDPSTQNACICSTVMYELVSACGACQGASWVRWDAWSANCPSNLITISYYSQHIPESTAIPAWAFYNPRFSDGNNPWKVRDVGALLAPNTSTSISSTPSSSSTSSSISTPGEPDPTPPPSLTVGEPDPTTPPSPTLGEPDPTTPPSVSTSSKVAFSISDRTSASSFSVSGSIITSFSGSSNTPLASPSASVTTSLASGGAGGRSTAGGVAAVLLLGVLAWYCLRHQETGSGPGPDVPITEEPHFMVYGGPGPGGTGLLPDHFSAGTGPTGGFGGPGYVSAPSGASGSGNGGGDQAPFAGNEPGHVYAPNQPAGGSGGPGHASYPSGVSGSGSGGGAQAPFGGNGSGGAGYAPNTPGGGLGPGYVSVPFGGNGSSPGYTPGFSGGSGLPGHGAGFGGASGPGPGPSTGGPGGIGGPGSPWVRRDPTAGIVAGTDGTLLAVGAVGFGVSRPSRDEDDDSRLRNSFPDPSAMSSTQQLIVVNPSPTTPTGTTRTNSPRSPRAPKGARVLR